MPNHSREKATDISRVLYFSHRIVKYRSRKTLHYSLATIAQRFTVNQPNSRAGVGASKLADASIELNPFDATHVYVPSYPLPPLGAPWALMLSPLAESR